MLHKFFEEGDWFAQKKFGYGAGFPIAWQGWVLLAVYFGIVLGLTTLPDLNTFVGLTIFVIGMLVSTGVLLLIAKRRTKGGWRWRP